MLDFIGLVLVFIGGVLFLMSIISGFFMKVGRKKGDFLSAFLGYLVTMSIPFVVFLIGLLILYRNE